MVSCTAVSSRTEVSVSSNGSIISPSTKRVEQFRTGVIIGAYQEVYAHCLNLTIIARALTQPKVAVCAECRKRRYQVAPRTALCKRPTRLFQLRDPDDARG